MRSAVTAAPTQVVPGGGVEDAARDLADLVPGAPDALQAAGDRRRRGHLHDEVDGAHVDAELEAGGGHDAAQPAGLEVVLDERALLLADRAVVGPGEHRLGTLGRCALPPISWAGGRVGRRVRRP